MHYEIHETQKGGLAKVIFEEGESLKDYRTFFDAIMEAPCDTTILEKTKINPDFFDLKTGFAGEILQKVSNYRKRLLILGDFSQITSKSLKDFIYESNKTGQVIFAPDLDTGVKLLR